MLISEHNQIAMTYGLQGHVGCVNAVAWNSKGSLLISGSDDTRVLFFLTLTMGIVILFQLVLFLGCKFGACSVVQFLCINISTKHIYHELLPNIGS